MARIRVPRTKAQLRLGRAPKDYNGAALLPQPTQALPGTEAKVQVLIERRRLGLELFHPQDARLSEAAKRGWLGTVDNFGGVTVDEVVEETARGVYQDVLPFRKLRKGA